MKIKKTKLFFEKHKIIILVIVVLLIALAVFFLVPTVFSRVNSDTSILDSNLVSAFLGAILGAIFSLIGSIYVNQKEMASMHNLNKKNYIFIPIYDELIENKNEIMKENPFPQFVSTNKGSQTIVPHPMYYTIKKISTDFRWLEVPKDLRNKIAELKEAIEAYLSSFEKINEPITNLLNEILLEELNISTTLMNIGDNIIGMIAAPKQNESIFDRYSLIIDGKYVSSVKINELDKKLICEGNKLHTVKELIEKRDSWLKIQDEILEYIEIEIKIINEKYSS